MSAAISDSFATLLRRIQPVASEVRARHSHAGTIRQAVRGEFSAVNRREVFGSHTRDTAVHIWSDVDYLAVLGKDDVTRGGGRVRSTATLSRLRKALAARFGGYGTKVKVRTPAVVVEFGRGKGAVDVVPAVWAGTGPRDGYPVFVMPDGRGGWSRTSPQRHAKFIKDEDARARGKLSSTAQLLKAWKYGRRLPVPIHGFHLELLLASEGICLGARSYAECVADALVLLRDRSGRALRDPLGIASSIRVAGTDAKRRDVVSATALAAGRALRAVRLDARGRTEQARRLWNLVFGKSFPAR